MTTAPYNFVALPDNVWIPPRAIPEPWTLQDRYHPDLHTGWVDLTLTSLTPLYIRGGRSAGQPDARLRSSPYLIVGRPAIPGSELRGMVSTLVEILSSSAISGVDNKQAAFRSIARPHNGHGRHPLDNYYRNRLNQPAVTAGIVTDDCTGVIPSTFVRVPTNLAGPTSAPAGVTWTITGATWGKLRPGYATDKADYKPPLAQQGRQCWVKLTAGTGHDATNRASEITFNTPGGPGATDFREGRLLLTGWSPIDGGKGPGPHSTGKCEYVVLCPDPAAQQAPLAIAESAKTHFTRQLSDWQEDAFGHGELRAGEPVFYVAGAHGNVVRLGRTRNFRVLYETWPENLAPPASPVPDLTRGLFGRLGRRQPPRWEPIASRLRFTAALADGDIPAGGWTAGPRVPRPLQAPKATAYGMYLVQPEHGLVTYMQDGDPRLRGHKLYWHRWPTAPTGGAVDDLAGLRELVDLRGNDGGTVIGERGDVVAAVRDGKTEAGGERLKPKILTVIDPVRSGVRYRSRIWFHNLDDHELGALVTALSLPAGCAHKLGMGRPLGLGSVKITAAVSLLDPAARYRSWTATGVRPDSAAVAGRLAQDFRSAMAARHGPGRQWDALPRTRQLLALLDFDGRPATHETANMEPAAFTNAVLTTPDRVHPDADAIAGWDGPPPAG